MITGILATWRLTSLLVSEAGPYDIFSKLRDRAGVYYDDYSEPQGTTELAKALTCIWCASIWVGAGVAVAQGYRYPTIILRALAYSAGAIILNKWVRS